jgi:hypothetical protein
MPDESRQPAVSTMNSVISSIENDRFTYRWFLTLITLPEVQGGFLEKNKINDDYAALKKSQTSKLIFYGVLGLVMAVACLTKQPWALLLGTIPLAFLFKLFRKNRKCVAAISRQFLIENIPLDALEQQTLYQTCESLSKKYSIPSLVDITAGQDSIGRKVLLGGLFFLPFIYFLTTKQVLLVTFILFWAVLALANLT